MTENAFYPVFLLWFFLLVLMLERPTILNQLGVLVAAAARVRDALRRRSRSAPALVTALVLMIAAEAWVATEPPPGAPRRARGPTG